MISRGGLETHRFPRTVPFKVLTSRVS